MTRQQILPSITLGLGLMAGALVVSGAEITWPSISVAKPIYSEPTPPALTTSNAVPPAVADVRALSAAFTELAEKVSPTVVNIYTKSGGVKSKNRGGGLPPEIEEQLENYFGFNFNQGRGFAPPVPRESLGSGFVINAEQGYLVTNSHVVRVGGKIADEIMVKFIGEENGKGHLAKVVGADEISDVALLKLAEKKPGLKAAVFGDSSKSKVGEWVLAIGNPYGHTHSVTQGIVSAIARSLEGARSEFLQTSASINPGNSGGPLINMNGEVIGINSAMDPRAVNIGFAIPSNTAKEIVSQLAESGRVHRAWLGIGIDDINEEVAGLMRLKETEGVLVKQVLAQGPAAKAGIETYDIIRKVNGTEVHNTRDLFKALAKLSAGKVTEVDVVRGSSRKTLKIQLGEQPANS